MLNLAILGLGGWGRNIVNNVQEKSDKARFSAAAVRTPARAEEFAAEKGLALSGDANDVFNNADIDGVVVAGPAHLHAETGLAALNAGKHAMIIKPFALTRADADMLNKTAADKGLTAVLGYDRCYLPAMDALRELVKSGALGQIVHAEGDFCAARYYNMKEGDWKSEDVNSPPGSLADHLMYLMIEMLGPVEALSVEARNAVTTVDLSDNAAVGLRLANGVTGALTAIGVTQTFERLQIFGTKGWAEVRNRTRLEFNPVEGDAVVSEHEIGPVLLRQIDAFADAINGDAAFPVTPDAAANSAACFEAMLKSKGNGNWVEL